MRDGERVPLLVGADGLPIPLPNRWALNVRRPRVQANTLTSDIRAIAYLYEWANRRSVDLRERFEAGLAIPSNFQCEARNDSSC